MAGKIVNEQGEDAGPARPTNLAPADRGAVTIAAQALMDGVPDAPDDDGSAILARIIDADDWESMNGQAKLPAAKDIAPCQLRVLSIVKRPSDLEADDDDTGVRLTHYLVVDSVNTATGEVIRWQTSAPAVALPLAKLAKWGKLPAVVQIAPSDKPTRRGFRPLNLTVLAVG